MIAGGLISGGGGLTGGDVAVRCGGVGGFPFVVTGSCLAAAAALAPGLATATGRACGFPGAVGGDTGAGGGVGFFLAGDCTLLLSAIGGEGGLRSFAGVTCRGVGVGFVVIACLRG